MSPDKNRDAMKSCCEDKRFGIPAEMLQFLLRKQMLHNGSMIPCLECRMMHMIERNELRPMHKMNNDSYKLYMLKFKEIFTEMHAEKMEAIAITELNEEFEKKPVFDPFTIRDLAGIMCIACQSSIFNELTFEEKEGIVDHFNEIHKMLFDHGVTKAERLAVWQQNFPLCIKCHKANCEVEQAIAGKN